MKKALLMIAIAAGLTGVINWGTLNKDLADLPSQHSQDGTKVADLPSQHSQDGTKVADLPSQHSQDGTKVAMPSSIRRTEQK